MPRRLHQKKLSGLMKSAADKKKDASGKRMRRLYKKGDTPAAGLLPQHVMDARPTSAMALLKMMHMRRGDTLVVLGCGRALEYIAGARELGVKQLAIELIDVELEAVELARQLLLDEGASVRDDGSYVLPPPSNVPHLRGCDVTFTLKVADLMQLESLTLNMTHLFTAALADAAMTRHVLHLAARSGPSRAVKLVMFLPRWHDVYMRNTVTATCTIQYTGSATASCRMLGMATVTPCGSPVVGLRVLARFKGGREMYEGTVKRINADATLAIAFDDGDVDERVRCHEWQAYSSVA